MSQQVPDERDMPSSVTSDVSLFDRFAAAAGTFVARSSFFLFCVLLVALWLPSFFLFGNIDTWQLVINTATTIITFLLVALLQNSQRRSDEAIQHKLNALADGLADLMDSLSHDHPKSEQLQQDLTELRDAVGLEHRESA